MFQILLINTISHFVLIYFLYVFFLESISLELFFIFCPFFQT